MAGLCCGVNLGEAEGATAVETIPSSKTSLRKRVEMHNFNFLPMDSAVAPVLEGGGKRMKCKIDPAVVPIISPRPRLNDSADSETGKGTEKSSSGSGSEVDLSSGIPKFGMTSVCGRRRDMEDAVAIHPSLFGKNQDCPSGLHFFGVYDGHGCSHVAARCRDRMHEIVKAEHESGGTSSWEETMVTSFAKMDKEVGAWCSSGSETSSCRCELKTPQCDAVGSTAVVAVVTPDKIIVSNCGDSRAVLCRNGVAIPLSVDHKPDRPDELKRIQEAGGRVIFWDGPRVLGMLAMSRAIGDNYLKPYVISEPEVTIYDRTAEDECLILASDGLWDVVSNETACGVARACLQSRSWSSQKSCGDASILLTKLALARLTADNVSVVVVDLRSPPTPRD